MYFTKEEKAAMYYYFSHMALADGVVENSEIQSEMRLQQRIYLWRYDYARNER